jgi:uncharacterized membrane protein (DUF373 family)
MASERWVRDKTEQAFGFVEDLLYVLVALALSLAGLLLFGYAIYEFATKVQTDPLSAVILALLDTLLLVFIITEIIHTIRVVIDEKVLISEPFLVVGIVAAIRRLVVVSAEAKDLFGKPDFGDAMLEIGVLTGTVLALGATIFMLRHTEHSEPRPTHEPGDQH